MSAPPPALAGKRIAVIAAHPDDEILGCGGTIARHIAAGATVNVLIVAEGATSRTAQRQREEQISNLQLLANSAQAAHQIIGTSQLTLLDFPDNRLDSVDFLDIVKAVETFIDATAPDTVYTHFPGDLNIDHRLVSEAVQTACRPQPGSGICRILFFEVASSTEWRMTAPAASFIPNYFVNIEATLGKKLEALAAYSQEMRPWPHTRSLEAVEYLARWRGASVGVSAAESYMLGRYLT
jgi:LmbE family N-acetylglucosaminyl deacetylase